MVTCISSAVSHGHAHVQCGQSELGQLVACLSCLLMLFNERLWSLQLSNVVLHWRQLCCYLLRHQPIPATHTQDTVTADNICLYFRRMLCFSWPDTLEQSSGRRYGRLVPARVSTQTENTSIPAILSGCYLVAACLWFFLAMVDLAVVYLSHLKNLYVM